MMISACGCIHVLVSWTAESLCFLCFRRGGAFGLLLILYMHDYDTCMHALLHHQIPNVKGFLLECRLLCAVLL